jgi:hypothetical protein
MPDDSEAEKISRQLRLPRTNVRPSGLRPGGLRAASAAAARAAANPSEATEPVVPEAVPAPPAAPAETSATPALTALVVYEILRALAMCSLFAVALGQAPTPLPDEAWDVYYIASNGSIVPTYLAVIYTVIAVAVGAGLWTRMPWARWALVAFSFIAMVQYSAWAFLMSMVVAAMRQPDTTQVDLARSITYAMIFANLAIVVYMTFSPVAAAAFEKQAASDPAPQLPPLPPSGS